MNTNNRDELDIDAILSEEDEWKESLKSNAGWYVSLFVVLLLAWNSRTSILEAIAMNRSLLNQASEIEMETRSMELGERANKQKEEIAKQRFEAGCDPVFSAANREWAELVEGFPVWNPNTNGFKEPGNRVCDPYGGTGVTAIRELDRNYISPSGYLYRAGTRVSVVTQYARTYDRNIISKVFAPELLAELDHEGQLGRVSNIRSESDR